LNAAKEENNKYYAQSNPFPSAEAIANIKSNEAAYAAWKADALDLASRGDCPPVPPRLGGTVFKNRLFEQVSRMKKLPGGAMGRICAPTFLFGFDQYLSESGGTPEKADIPKLYVQLTTITNVVDILAKSGVLEVRAFERLAAKEESDEGNARNARQRNKPKGKGTKGEVEDGAPKRYDYRLEYTARASAFVKVLNGFAKSPRFYVVSDFGFEREGDSLKARLDRSPSAQSSSKGRGRWGRDREKKEQEVESGFVTNPETDPPLFVHMTLSVYDFGRKGTSVAPAAAAPESADSKKEGK
jgi:hypothetical protein